MGSVLQHGPSSAFCFFLFARIRGGAGGRSIASGGTARPPRGAFLVAADSAARISSTASKISRKFVSSFTSNGTCSMTSRKPRSKAVANVANARLKFAPKRFVISPNNREYPPIERIDRRAPCNATAALASSSSSPTLRFVKYLGVTNALGPSSSGAVTSTTISSSSFSADFLLLINRMLPGHRIDIARASSTVTLSSFTALAITRIVGCMCCLCKNMHARVIASKPALNRRSAAHARVPPPSLVDAPAPVTISYDRSLAPFASLSVSSTSSSSPRVAVVSRRSRRRRRVFTAANPKTITSVASPLALAHDAVPRSSPSRPVAQTRARCSGKPYARAMARRTSSMEDVPKSSNSTLLTTPRTSLATMVARARGSGVVFIA
mmetsp:Transcript_3024/g.11594  ORF Transcript_3024/g.11594 Transcript_3024/m.11594 type:complete len:380 (-) Transcript_3024:14-1153(-)